MQKWEYLTLEWFNDLKFAPHNSVFAEWLKSRFPRAKIREHDGMTLVDDLVKEDAGMIYEVIQFLGSQGWEAVKLGWRSYEGTAWFKRPIED